MSRDPRQPIQLGQGRLTPLTLVPSGTSETIDHPASDGSDNGTYQQHSILNSTLEASYEVTTEFNRRVFSASLNQLHTLRGRLAFETANRKSCSCLVHSPAAPNF